MEIDNEKVLAKTDPILEKIILQLPKPTINSTKNVFHDIMSCIIEKQIHYRSTKRIFSKALERAGIEHLTLQNFNLLEQHSLPQIKFTMRPQEICGDSCFADTFVVAERLNFCASKSASCQSANLYLGF